MVSPGLSWSLTGSLKVSHAFSGSLRGFHKVSQGLSQDFTTFLRVSQWNDSRSLTKALEKVVSRYLSVCFSKFHRFPLMVAQHTTFQGSKFSHSLILDAMVTTCFKTDINKTTWEVLIAETHWCTKLRTTCDKNQCGCSYTVLPPFPQSTHRFYVWDFTKGTMCVLQKFDVCKTTPKKLTSKPLGKLDPMRSTHGHQHRSIWHWVMSLIFRSPMPSCEELQLTGKPNMNHVWKHMFQQSPWSVSQVVKLHAKGIKCGSKPTWTATCWYSRDFKHNCHMTVHSFLISCSWHGDQP